VYPYPIFDWIEGVRRHSKMHLALPMGQGFVATWLTRPELPLLGLSFGLLGVAAVTRITLVARSLERSHLIVFGLLLVLFSAGFIRIAILKTEASYNNAVVWVPLLACLGLSGNPGRRRSWLVVLALVLPAMGIARSSVILAGQFDSRAVGFREVREKIREMTPLGCAVSPGLWMAVDDVTKVTFTNPADPQQRFFVRQETNTGQSYPTDYPGYELLDNRFAPGIKVFGLPLARTSGGWQFAVYEEQR